MENRDRDKLSRNTSSTSAGDLNRKTSSKVGQEKSDSSVEFGQKIGSSEGLGNESSRTSEGGRWSGSSGSSGSSGMSGSEHVAKKSNRGSDDNGSL